MISNEAVGEAEADEDGVLEDDDAVVDATDMLGVGEEDEDAESLDDAEIELIQRAGKVDMQTSGVHT